MLVYDHLFTLVGGEYELVSVIITDHIAYTC